MQSLLEQCREGCVTVKFAVDVSWGFFVVGLIIGLWCGWLVAKPEKQQGDDTGV